MNYNQGSFWRKWDLHVHSPYSVLNNGDFGNAFDKQGVDLQNTLDKYVFELFTRAIENEVYCIGITDYFVIEGYKAIKDILNDEMRLKRIFSEKLTNEANYLERVKEILILPNVEFRLDNSIFVGSSNGSVKASKLQIHVIFSNELSTQQIESDFLHVLKFTDVNQRERYLNINSIKNHGESLKKSGVGGNGSDLIVGMNGTQVSFDDIKKKVMTSFKNKAIIVLAEEDQSDLSWSGQAGALRRKFYSDSNAIFSANPKTIIWSSSEDSIITINKKIACLWGSDAHTYDSLFVPSNDRYCWIKSDTTFEGLLQATEVAIERVFIGKIPPGIEAFKERSAYTIKEIRIKKKSRSTSRVWFDSDISVNPFMVTIIGNKGSGKSALSDIIGYIGNSHNIGNASFLDSKRFLDKKTRYGDEYQAEIEFHAGENKLVKKEILSQSFDDDFPEIVKYLPQRFIEEICNDITDAFQKEINSAIFSYVPLHEKNGVTNINDLILIKTDSIQNQINNRKHELHEVNDKIINLENKSKSSYTKYIKNNLEEAKNRLLNHLENKPIPVTKPTDLESSEFAKDTIEINKLIEIELEKASILTANLTSINISLQKISDFCLDLEDFEVKKRNINNEYRELTKLLGIEDYDFVTVQYNKEVLNLKLHKLKTDKIELTNILDQNKIELDIFDLPNLNVDKLTIIEHVKSYTSIYEKIYVYRKYVESISQNITNAQLNYFEYQEKFKQWELTRKIIEGTVKSSDGFYSIKQYEEELDYLTQKLPKELMELYDYRIKLIENIIDLIFCKVKIYESIYEPVQNRISSIDGFRNSNIEFNATIKADSNIVDSIISFIDSRVDSGFKGAKEGRNFISNIIESTDFSNKASILEMIKVIFKETNSKPDIIDSLLKDRQGFNNFIGNLEYLTVNFTIKAEGKQLNELSPGERGIVLLIFYLALSKGEKPLIIDQPEDNLDNQSVFSKLVPAIVEAKKNRQIFVVTHNPNIAIACDSEQVIYCEVNPTSKTLEYTMGSIENLKIKKHIIDILEGTKPAFDRRKITYEDS